MDLQYIVFLGAAIQLLFGVLPYIRDTVEGKTKPNRISWLMWSIAPLIATFAALSDGVRLAVLPVFISGFGPLLIFLSSFYNKKSYWKLEKLDYICGLLSVLALILWWITKDPDIAIIFAIASDGFAAVPTLLKSWNHPETETVSVYVSGLFNTLTGFFAINIWNFSSLGFLIYIFLIDAALTFSVYQKRIFNKKSLTNP